MKGQLFSWVGLPVVLVALLIAVACGGGQAPDPPAPKAPATQAPTLGPTAAPTATAVAPTATVRPVTPSPTPVVPKRGGILRTNFVRNLRTIDSYPTRDGGLWPSINPELNYLVRNYQFKGELQPDLADKWSISADGLVYTFNLNAQAAWSDGKPVSADDVVWSLQRLAGKQEIPAGFFNFTVTNVQKYEAVDAKTVRLTLGIQQASFLAGLGAVSNTIYAKHTNPDSFKTLKVPDPGFPTSGPFVMTEYTPDVLYRLQRNAKYWKKDGFGTQLPYLDGVVSFIIPDRTAAYSALRTGQLDLPAAGLFSPIVGRVEQAKKDLPGLQVVFAANDLPLWFRNDGLTKDIRLRQAVQLAIDRQVVKDLMWRGEATPYQIYNISGGKWALPDAEISKLPGYNPDTKAQDIKRANDLLDAFLKDKGETRATLSTKLIISTNISAYPTEHETVQAQLKANLGLELKVAAELAPQEFQRLADKNFNIHIAGNAPAIDDPDFAFTGAVGTGAGSNFGGVSDPDIDAALLAIAKELDSKKRLELSRALERKLYDLAWHVFLGAQLQPTAAIAVVKGDWMPLHGQDGGTWQKETIWLDR